MAFLDETGLARVKHWIDTLLSNKVDKVNGKALSANDYTDAEKTKLEKLSGIYPVIGTQTGTTASWTGNIDAPALYNGMTIAYYLPRTSAANVTLNLTLSTGSKTGAIYVYYTSTTRMGTHYAAGSVIILTYFAKGAVAVNGTAIAQARWLHCDYDTTAGFTQYGRVMMGSVQGYPYRLLMQEASGKFVPICLAGATTDMNKARFTGGLRFPDVWYYNGSNEPAANTLAASIAENNRPITLSYSANCNGLLEVGKMVYLVGEVHNDGLFYLDSTWWTQTEPTNADGKTYIPVGVANGTSGIYFGRYRQVCRYENGAFQTYGAEEVISMTVANGVLKLIKANARTVQVTLP